MTRKKKVWFIGTITDLAVPGDFPFPFLLREDWHREISPPSPNKTALIEHGKARLKVIRILDECEGEFVEDLRRICEAVGCDPADDDSLFSRFEEIVISPLQRQKKR